MPFYQSISEILSENRQDMAGISTRTAKVVEALDGLGRELDATVFLDPEFSQNQATSVAKGDADLALFGVPLAHKELYGRHTETAIWPDEGGSKSCKGQLAKNLPDHLAHGQQDHPGKQCMGERCVHKAIGKEPDHMFQWPSPGFQHPVEYAVGKGIGLDRRSPPAHAFRPANKTPAGQTEDNLDPQQDQEQGRDSWRQRVNGWSVVGCVIGAAQAWVSAAS